MESLGLDRSWLPWERPGTWTSSLTPVGFVLAALHDLWDPSSLTRD